MNQVRWQFQGNKVAFVGAFGQAEAQWVRSVLAKQACELVVVTPSPSEALESLKQEGWGFTLHCNDCTNAKWLDAVLAGSDYVFHMLGMPDANQCELSPFEAVRMNILLTKNVVEAAVRSGSGTIVYIAQPQPPATALMYGLTKKTAEALIAEARRLHPQVQLISVPSEKLVEECG